MQTLIGGGSPYKLINRFFRKLPNDLKVLYLLYRLFERLFQRTCLSERSMSKAVSVAEKVSFLTIDKTVSKLPIIEDSLGLRLRRILQKPNSSIF